MVRWLSECRKTKTKDEEWFRLLRWTFAGGKLDQEHGEVAVPGKQGDGEQGKEEHYGIQLDPSPDQKSFPWALQGGEEN